MKRIALTAAASIVLAWAPMANAQEALAKGAGCLNCHSPDVKKVGPSFKDIAAKHKGKPEAEATLVAKLADSKQHPATKTNPNDLKSLVKWILAM